jgi:hypothetical protein
VNNKKYDISIEYDGEDVTIRGNNFTLSASDGQVDSLLANAVLHIIQGLGDEIDALLDGSGED